MEQNKADWTCYCEMTLLNKFQHSLRECGNNLLHDLNFPWNSNFYFVMLARATTKFSAQKACNFQQNTELSLMVVNMYKVSSIQN
jgi:hypothetical protein